MMTIFYMAFIHILYIKGLIQNYYIFFNLLMDKIYSLEFLIKNLNKNVQH